MKRRAVGDRTTTADGEFLRQVARLSLATAATVRQIKGVVCRTLLIPSTCEIISLVKSATKELHGQSTISTAQTPPHVVVFVTICKWIAACADCPADAQKLISNFLTSVPPEELKFQVLVARISKCFDASKTRIELAVTNEAQPVTNAVISQLVKKGGKLCFGAAPRGPLEREVQARLASAASVPTTDMCIG